MDKFVKDQNIFDIDDKEKNLQLINSIIKTRKDLKQAHINFEFAEQELIDYYSYQIKANQSKLDYLIKLAKSKNLILSRVEHLEIHSDEAV